MNPIALIPGRLAAAVALVGLLPLMMLIALAVRLTYDRPPLTWRWRKGLRGRSFRLYGFTTTQSARPLDRERSTTIGQWLRRTGLERLPQLYNIVRGELAWFGPRPLPHGEDCSDIDMRFLVAMPGMISLSDVSGGDLLAPRDKQAIDAWQARNASAGLNLEIGLKVLAAIMTRPPRNELLIAAAHRQMWGYQR